MPHSKIRTIWSTIKVRRVLFLRCDHTLELSLLAPICDHALKLLVEGIITFLIILLSGGPITFRSFPFWRRDSTQVDLRPMCILRARPENLLNCDLILRPFAAKSFRRARGRAQVKHCSVAFLRGVTQYLLQLGSVFDGAAARRASASAWT